MAGDKGRSHDRSGRDPYQDVPERPDFEFYGCYLSAAFLSIEDLGISDRVLLCIVEALSHNKQECCYASNEYLAWCMRCTEREVRRRLMRLEDANYIVRDVQVNKGSDQGGKTRRLYPTDKCPRTRVLPWQGNGKPIRSKYGTLKPPGG